MAAASSLVPALEIASALFLWKDWGEAEAIIRSDAFDHVFVPTGPGLGVTYDWDYIRAHETARELFKL